jgi:acyl carrier protein
MSVQIESVIRKFIGENFPYREAGVSLTDTTSFLENGLIDSTGVLELVFFLEKTFGIQMADDEILPDNLDSIRRIADYIRRKQGGPVSPALSDGTQKEDIHYASRTAS